MTSTEDAGRTMREALDAALLRLARFPDGSAKALLASQAKSLGRELDVWRAAPAKDALELLRRKINLLHVVLVKAERPERRRSHAYSNALE